MDSHGRKINLPTMTNPKEYYIMFYVCMLFIINNNIDK